MSSLPPAFLAELKDRTSIVEVVSSRIQLRRKGREHVAPCPFHNEKTGSFTVNEAKSFFHCFGCGAHGDAVGFLMRHDGVGFLDAVRTLAALAGMVMPGESKPGQPRPNPRPKVERPTAEQERADKERLIAWARDVWAGRQPWEGSLVEAYLRGRGIVPPAGLPTLGFAPALPYRLEHEDGRVERLLLPAQLAPMQQADGRITGIHRTYLRADGTGKAAVPSAKKMGGVCWGAAIRFAKAGAKLALGEGIETCLSVRQALPDLPIWAAGSLGNIAGQGDEDGPRVRHPNREDKWLPTVMPDMRRPGLVLPDFVQELLILADADGDRPSGEALVERAARRFRARGLKVRVAWPPAGMDFNDMVRAGASGADLQTEAA